MTKKTKPTQQERAPMGDRLTLSVHEAAEICGVSERTLWELVARKEVPVVRLGRRVLIVKTQLEAWLNDRSSAAAV